MKKILVFNLAFLLSVGMISCGNSQDKNANSKQAASSTIAKDINSDQFQEMMSSKKNAIVLDVRTPQEVASGSIEGRVALDYYASDFMQQIDKLDKDAPILIYCAVGGRSGDAMRKMKKMGFKEVYNLSGGIRAWQSQGKPVK